MIQGFQDYDWTKVQKVYAGLSGTGKTTLFSRHYFREENARIKFLFDHKAMEFSRRYLRREPIFSLNDIPLAVANIVRSGKSGIVVNYSPMYEFPGENEEAFDAWCEVVFACCENFKGRKLIGADELQVLQGPNSKPKALLKICDVGRTYQMDCFFIASAMNSVHNLVKNQITELFAFKQGDSRAAEWLAEKGFDVQKLFNLKKGEFHRMNFETGEIQQGGKGFKK